MKNLFTICTIVVGCFLVACGKQVNHHGRTPLVSVDDHYLYVEDLRVAMPEHISKDDSVLFAEHYIRNWVEDMLLLENARRNVDDDEALEKLVENYRRSLVLHTYQQQLIEQRLINEISETEIDSFYQSNQTLFRLEMPLLKGVYIKVPLKTKGLNQVKEWYKKKAPEEIEKLEKYCLQHAADYSYFYDSWLPLNEISSKLPLEQEKALSYIKANKYVELKDTLFNYFLHVDTLLDVGQQTPIDYAKIEIREVLMNMKRVTFMKKVRGELYSDAVNDDRIKYYY